MYVCVHGCMHLCVRMSAYSGDLRSNCTVPPLSCPALECGLRSTATTEQWYSYGECISAMYSMCVACLCIIWYTPHLCTHTCMDSRMHTDNGICAMTCTIWLTAPLL